MMKTSKGFTLMEILVAMAILGIIAGVGFSSYTISIQKARDSQRKSDLAQIAKALEAYQSDFAVYPASQYSRVAGCGNGIQGDGIDGTETCSWGAAFSLDNGKIYMKTMPKDVTDQQYYIYQASADRRKYQLFAKLENTKDPSVNHSLTVICTEDGDPCNYGIASSNATIDETL